MASSNDLMTGPLISTNDDRVECFALSPIEDDMFFNAIDEALRIMGTSFPTKDTTCEPSFPALDDRALLDSFTLQDHDTDLNEFVTLLEGNVDENDEDSNHENGPTGKDEQDLLSDGLCVLDSVENINANASLESQQDAELSFPFKLHLMLDRAERDKYAHIVSWVMAGTAFKVHNTRAFVEQVMPNFFNQSKYESFRRQLNLYHYSRVAQGGNRGIISHPSFIRGAPELCKDIKRTHNSTEC